MKKYIIIISLLLITISTNAQIISGRFSSSLYSFKRYDTTDVANSHLRAFQMLNLNINVDKFSLKSYLNYEGDLSNQNVDDPRLRFYNLYLEGRDLMDLFTLKIGRQPLFNSIGGGLFDGVNLDVKKEDYKLTAYYGGNVPAYQKLETTNNWSEDFIVGGKFTTIALQNFQVSLSYVNKNFKPQDYWATRLDANLNPITVLINNNSTQFQFASAEVSYGLKDILSIDTRFDYDLNFEKASKFEINGSYEKIDNLRLNVYYNYREPRINYNSIFSVFDYGNSQEIELGGDYIINDLLTVTGRFGNVTYKDDNSQRVTLGLASKYGNISYRKTLGYEGELDAISIYSAHSFFEGLLTPSIGGAYTNYKLSLTLRKII